MHRKTSWCTAPENSVASLVGPLWSAAPKTGRHDVAWRPLACAAACTSVSATAGGHPLCSVALSSVFTSGAASLVRRRSFVVFGGGCSATGAGLVPPDARRACCDVPSFENDWIQSYCTHIERRMQRV